MPLSDQSVEELAANGDVQSLIQLLTFSDDVKIRYTAAEALGKLGDIQAVPSLIEALSDEYWFTRSLAATALGRLGDHRAVEPLINSLHDQNDSPRKSAAMALGALMDPRAVEPLILALSDPYFSVRGCAAFSLEQLGDARAIDPLILLLQDREDCVCADAANALGGLGAMRAVEPLMSHIYLGERQLTFKAAVNALVKLNDPRAVVKLIAYLENPRSKGIQKEWVIDALCEIGDPRAIPALKSSCLENRILPYRRQQIEESIEKISQKIA